MIDILVRIYSDEELTQHVSSYRNDFIAVPRVDEYISKHVHIEGALTCCVKKVIFIPKLPNSQDCDVMLKCIHIKQGLID